jgi:hypothetical protein
MTLAKTPTVVQDETAAMDLVAATPERSRPVVAINGEGKLVVCCRTTAKKYDWEIQGKLYSRVRTGKRAAINTKGELVAEVAALEPEPRKTARRAADAAVTDRRVGAKNVFNTTIEELLK